MTLLVSDPALRLAFRQGERLALERVYEAYVERVIDVLRHGFAFDSGERRLRFAGFADPLELENFAQEVFVRAFAERARLMYDGLRPFEGYLLRIAKNIVIDELRRRRSTPELVSADTALDVVLCDTGPSPEDVAVAAATKKLVAGFLAKCTGLERRYVALRYEEDASLLAAARALGISRMRARWLERQVLGELALHLHRSGFADSAAPVAPAPSQEVAS